MSHAGALRDVSSVFLNSTNSLPAVSPATTTSSVSAFPSSLMGAKRLHGIANLVLRGHRAAKVVQKRPGGKIRVMFLSQAEIDTCRKVYSESDGQRNSLSDLLTMLHKTHVNPLPGEETVVSLVAKTGFTIIGDSSIPFECFLGVVELLKREHIKAKRSDDECAVAFNGLVPVASIFGADVPFHRCRTQDFPDKTEGSGHEREF